MDKIDPYQVVRDFEKAMAQFTGFPFAVAVESCSAAIFLCCLYSKVKDYPEIEVPKFTYPSVPASIIHAGGRVKFTNLKWQWFGAYRLRPTYITDSAKRINKYMYTWSSSKTSWTNLVCLSFHGKKIVPIGRGGMILTDSKEAVEWFKVARFDGRHERPLQSDTLAMAGWNMYMTPEQASRGLVLMQWLKDYNVAPPDSYQDLSQYKFFTEANR